MTILQPGHALRIVPDGSKTFRTKTVIHYAEPVPHRVVWTSKQVRSPFNAVVGRKSPFGVFSDPRSKGLMLQSPLQALETSRSSFLSLPVLFQDIHGNRYRWLNIKGAGLIAFGASQKYRTSTLILSKKEGGIFDWKYARHSRDASEALLKAGVRIAPDIAHIRILKHPGYDGKGGKMRLKDFPPSIEPVVALRAFGCRGRLRDAGNPQLLREAIEVVKKELGVKRLSKTRYAEWFAQTLGKNIAIMHSHNWTHGFLQNEHNFTLDARLVDFDSLKGFGINKHESKEELTRDLFKDSGDAAACLYKIALAAVKRKGTDDKLVGRAATRLGVRLEFMFFNAYVEQAVAPLRARVRRVL